MVEFDGHRLDIRLKVVTRDPFGFEHEFEIERAWLPVIIDVCTRAVFGYHIACPNEVSAALLATELGKLGFRESLPLHGGIEAWLAAGFPVETVSSLNNVNAGKRGEILFPWPVGADAG
ncbi:MULTISPECIES: hypothetical protein [unclassified Paraburkholderia]|uniref:hypothetical protein n=1 Tax=unclassified Paraburkholderia TaxID=2615204 RepID=UPI0038BAD5D0